VVEIADESEVKKNFKEFKTDSDLIDMEAVY
jgi:hypothetical protein